MDAARMRLAGKADIPVREHVLKRDDLGHVSELVLAATTSELLLTVRVDDQRIGDGKSGPIVRRLQPAYADAVREFPSMGTAILSNPALAELMGTAASEVRLPASTCPLRSDTPRSIRLRRCLLRSHRPGGVGPLARYGS